MSYSMGIIYEWTTCEGGATHSPPFTGAISSWANYSMAGEKVFRFIRAEASDGTDIYVVFKSIKHKESNQVVEIMTYDNILDEKQRYMTEAYICSKLGIKREPKDTELNLVGFIT